MVSQNGRVRLEARPDAESHRMWYASEEHPDVAEQRPSLPARLTGGL